jgi:hypothetical protein
MERAGQTGQSVRLRGLQSVKVWARAVAARARREMKSFILKLGMVCDGVEIYWLLNGRKI